MLDERLYLVVRDGIYYVHGTVDGRRIRRSCETRDHTVAQRVLHDIAREHTSGWRVQYDESDNDWRSIAAEVHARHKSSAKVRGILFDLKPLDVYAMMEATGFRCAVSGVPFSRSAAGKRDPWAPSIDRIENRHGYTRDNVRVVSLAANIAMNNWGYDVLLRLSLGVARSSSTVSPVVQELTHQERGQNENTAQIIDIKGQS
jgi:hypothetical protein